MGFDGFDTGDWLFLEMSPTWHEVMSECRCSSYHEMVTLEGDERHAEYCEIADSSPQSPARQIQCYKVEKSNKL